MKHFLVPESEFPSAAHRHRGTRVEMPWVSSRALERRPVRVSILKAVSINLLIAAACSTAVAGENPVTSTAAVSGSAATTPESDAPVPAWAVSSGQDKYGRWADLVVGGVTQRFRWINPGTFVMGSPKSEKNDAVAAGAVQGWLEAYEKQHEVTLTHGFWLADTPCTQGLWQAVLGGNPSKFTGDSNLPVEQVSWNDCQDFFAKLNSQIHRGGFRLPTEAQWEYAARAGTTGAQYGNLDEIAWYDGNSERHTHPVEQKKPNDWGLYDMIGNVWQWCDDWLGESAGGAQRDPTGPSSGPGRVRRGASWSNLARYCRAAIRLNGSPTYQNSNLGFRISISEIPVNPLKTDATSTEKTK